MSIGLLIIRLMVGLTLASHGSQKLFGWFGGPGLVGAGQFMETLGFVPGRRSALLAGMAEAGGGLLLAVGFLTPAAAAAILGTMLVAASAGFSHGFFAQRGGFEYTAVLGLVALALAFTGPGALSADQYLGLRWTGPWWGLAAAVAGLGAGAIRLATRRRTETPTYSVTR